MGQFSDDGQWWWDGAQWIATPQVVLPDLPMSEFERSGKLNEARRGMKKRHTQLPNVVFQFFPQIGMVLAIPYLDIVYRAAVAYRL